MSQNDGEININTKIETKDAEKELNSLGKSLKDLANGNTLKKITAIGSTFAGVTTAIKATNKVIKETSELYRNQITAEKQLETAAKNNPYLNNESVQNLKDYASYLQSIGTVGDETLIPLMAQLASTGRTESEIQDIMSASLDLSASGMMSLDSAVQALNGTLSGNAGMLSRQITQIKGLSDEELRAGKAIEIVKQNYAGMAKEVANATGSAQQLKNAIGDYKEEIGASFEKNLKPMRSFFTELISKWTEAKKARREYEEIVDQNDEGKGTSETLKTQLDNEQKTLEDMATRATNATELLKKTNKELRKSDEFTNFSTWNDSDIEGFRSWLQEQIDLYDQQKTKVEQLNTQLKEQNAQEAELAKQNKTKQEQQERQEKINQANKDAYTLITNNTDAMNKQIEQVKIRAKLNNEEVDEQEILNIMTESYIELVTTDTNLVTQNNQAAKERLKLIEEQSKKVNVEMSEYEKLEDVIKKYATDSVEEQRDALEATKKSLLDLDVLKLTGEELDNVRKAVKGIDEALKDLNETTEEEQNKGFDDILESLNNYVSQYQNALSTLSEFAESNAEKEADYKLAVLQKQYEDGIVSEEEYYNQKSQIEKEQAQADYKVQMWEWSASVAQITLNTIKAVTEALADGPTGIAMAAVMGTLGAAQLAQAIGAKPTPPAFASGGIVGASLGADNTIATIRTGEMVLNAVQQKELWKMANGNTSGAKNGTNINIKNYRGNDTTVTPQIDENGITLIIQKTVNEQLAKGTFNKSLISANNSLHGISYTN